MTFCASSYRRLQGQFFAAACIAGSWALPACGKPSAELREWTPADHAQPAAAQPGAVGAGGASTTGQVAQAEAPVNAIEARARAAQALWNVSCAQCHGRGGQGDGPGKPPGAAVPDFTLASFQKERTDQALADVILNGRGMMPAFSKQLNPDGVSALIAQIRAFGPAEPVAAPDAPAAPKAQ